MVSRIYCDQAGRCLWQAALAPLSQSKGFPPGVKYVLMLAQEIEPLPEDPNVLILRFCIDDNAEGLQEPAFRELNKLCRLLSRELDVITVCHMGENRSGLASALILMHLGFTSEDAIACVRENAKVYSQGVQYALWNPGFAQQILGHSV